MKTSVCFGFGIEEFVDNEDTLVLNHIFKYDSILSWIKAILIKVLSSDSRGQVLGFTSADFFYVYWNYKFYQNITWVSRLKLQEKIKTKVFHP